MSDILYPFNFNKNELVNVSLDKTMTNLTVESQFGYSTTLKHLVWNNGTSIVSFLDTKLNELSLPNSSVDLNNQRLIKLADPIDLTDAVNKSYVNRLYNLVYQELLLHENQLNNTNSSINQATLLVFESIPNDGDFIVFNDGVSTEIYEFDNNSSISGSNISVTIQGTLLLTINEFINIINSTSSKYYAVLSNNLSDIYNSYKIIIYRRLQLLTGQIDRVYGTFTNQNDFKHLNYNGESDYSKTVLNSLSTTDPNFKTFGFGRVNANLLSNELHSVKNNNLWYSYNKNLSQFEILNSNSFPIKHSLYFVGDGVSSSYTINHNLNVEIHNIQVMKVNLTTNELINSENVSINYTNLNSIIVNFLYIPTLSDKYVIKFLY